MDNQQVKQAVLDFLPGYMFDGNKVVSTGVAIPPTQFIDKKTGDVKYYVRPVFEFGPIVGFYVRHKGIVDWINSTKGG